MYLDLVLISLSLVSLSTPLAFYMCLTSYLALFLTLSFSLSSALRLCARFIYYPKRESSLTSSSVDVDSLPL